MTADVRNLAKRPIAILHSFIGAVLVAGALVACNERPSDVSSSSRTPAAPNIPAVPVATKVSHPPMFTRWSEFEVADEKNRAILAKDYVDAMIGHQVFSMPPRNMQPRLAQQLLLDDDQLLFSSGRRLWNRELLHQPGMAGKFCYLHSTYCLRRLFDTAFFIDDKPVVIYDNQYAIERYPSHTVVRYSFPEVEIAEYKFITMDDRATATYVVQSRDKKPHRVALEVTATYPPIPGGKDQPSFPQLAAGNFQGKPLFLYLDAPGFERTGSLLPQVRKILSVDASGSDIEATVAVRYDNVARAVPEKPFSADPAGDHIREYQSWFADNVPYFNCSDVGFKVMWYYRWWIVRFHLTEAETPDLTGSFFYEGKMGFDNVIGFAVPAQLKELAYLRDPKYAVSQARNSYRNRSPNGTIVDPPGSPYWGENYSQWVAMALAELHRVQPLSADVINELLPAAAADVRGWMTAYDGDHDGLPERVEPRVTGYDLDILSYWHFNDLKLNLRANPPALERADFAAFVYSNARGVAELAEIVGDKALAAEMSEEADRIRSAALAHLWDDNTGFFYPQTASGDQRVPMRELHGFFPFANLLVPNEPRYMKALEKFVDPQEFWSRFPPVITSQVHYRNWTWEMDGLTRNIAPHPISMGGRTLLQVLKHYDQPSVQPGHFMELMERYNDLVYPGIVSSNPYWRPNVHEYYSKWEPNAQGVRPKPSDISHDFHSMWLSLVIEGAVGLTPRNDEKIEIQPLATNWTHFVVDRLRYHGHDLTILWDKSDGRVEYAGRPEGFSLWIDDQLAFTQADLGHVLYDPETKTVEPVVKK